MNMSDIGFPPAEEYMAQNSLKLEEDNKSNKAFMEQKSVKSLQGMLKLCLMQSKNSTSQVFR